MSDEPDISAAEQLAILLDLPSVGLSVRGARIVGRGSRASVDIYLSDGSEIFFERFSDFANPTRLAIEMATCTGARPRLKAPQAIQAVALVRAIAEHTVSVTMDNLSRDWGLGFMQSAPALDLDITDAHDRWQAFSTLERTDPYALARQDAITIAQACLVLAHTDGSRYVRCGWFRMYVRTEEPALSSHQIADRMKRVGWERRGAEGRVKASQPGGHRQLVWPFYIVPAGWEPEQDTGDSE